MFEDLAGRRILVTGGSSGIGASTAQLLAGHGAIVGIHYNTGKDRAERLAASIRAQGGTAHCLEADLLKSRDRDALIPAFAEVAGGIDGLINSAGAVIGDGHFLDLETEPWRQTFSLNAEAPFFLAISAFRLMADRGGRIVNVSSVAAKYGGSDRSIHYGAAKAALENLTVALAKRGATLGILVNCIRAGVIDTPFHEKFHKPDFEERLRLIPVGRAGRPDDVAGAALFLCSEAGSYITGQIISVTGGE